MVFLSIIIPVFNEEENIQVIINRLLPLVKPYKSEIIFVNDGSTDTTEAVIKQLISKHPNIKLISFYRNFGHQMALTAGYEYAKGDAVVTIDADLQDPPELIADMVKKWQEGAMVVYAKRVNRKKDTWFKQVTAELFYRLINLLSDRPIPTQVGDFRLLDKKVVAFLNALPEKSRFLRGLVAWPGFPVAYVEHTRDKRHAGQTHYPLSKMVTFALEGLLSFSTKPLRMASYLGFGAAVLGFFGILYAVIGKFVFASSWVSGWTALFVGIMFIGGVQLICLGIIGEYIGTMYKEIQGRPKYVIKDTVNV